MKLQYIGTANLKIPGHDILLTPGLIIDDPELVRSFRHRPDFATVSEPKPVTKEKSRSRDSRDSSRRKEDSK